MRRACSIPACGIDFHGMGGAILPTLFGEGAMKETDLLKFDKGEPPTSWAESPIDHVLETVEDIIEFGDYAVRCTDHANKEWMQNAILKIVADLRYVYEEASSLVLLVEDSTCSTSSTSAPSSPSTLTLPPTNGTSTSAGRRPSATRSSCPGEPAIASGPLSSKSTASGCGKKSRLAIGG